MVYDLEWSKQAKCLDAPVDLFFETYEVNAAAAYLVDATYCMECPVQRICLTKGVGHMETGVWGGIYLEEGKISAKYNIHKSKEDWGQMWLRLTTLIS